MRRQSVIGILALSIGLCSAVAFAAQQAQQGGKTDRQLALLISVPDDAHFPEAAWNDQTVVYEALRARGLRPGQIMSLSGHVERKSVLEFLREAGNRVSNWQDGVVMLYYSGSGYWPIEENVPFAKVKTGMKFGEGANKHVLWDEVFATLDVPPGVQLLLFPDCCYTNTLVDKKFANKVPKNVSGMVLLADPRKVKCKADSVYFVVNGKKTQHGIITHYAAQALRTATTIEDWVVKANALTDQGVANNNLDKSRALHMQILGDPKQRLFGP